ncbi:hypothetical protein KEM52_005053 [Ascosphaera acerosa]|nr:hypothetical protein KEM52_005053 [Ascosphaera acerosa]
MADSGTSMKTMWASLVGSSREASDAGQEAATAAKDAKQTATVRQRLVNSLLEQIIDPGLTSAASQSSGKDDDASAAPVSGSGGGGPLGNGLSLPLMADNFRRFNGRIGVVFNFQHQVELLLAWHNPTETLALLATYTLVCLHPALLASLPLAVFVLFIMVPGYVARHPPPPVAATSSTTAYYAYDGPALAPGLAAADVGKPAAELSRDFLDNMAHLQKSMGDFADAYDAVVAALLPAADFSNERLSSAIFLAAAALLLALLCTAHLVPRNLVVLVAGDAAVLAGNERVRWHARRALETVRSVIGSGAEERQGTDGDESGRSSPVASRALDTLKSMMEVTLTPTSPEITLALLRPHESRAVLDEVVLAGAAAAPPDPLTPLVLPRASRTVGVYQGLLPGTNRAGAAVDAFRAWLADTGLSSVYAIPAANPHVLEKRAVNAASGRRSARLVYMYPEGKAPLGDLTIHRYLGQGALLRQPDCRALARALEAADILTGRAPPQQRVPRATPRSANGWVARPGGQKEPPPPPGPAPDVAVRYLGPSLTRIGVGIGPIMHPSTDRAAYDRSMRLPLTDEELVRLCSVAARVVPALEAECEMA